MDTPTTVIGEDTKAPDPIAFEFGRFRLNVVAQTLVRDGRPVAITPRAVAMLLTLVRNRSQIVVKEDLLRQVWPNSFVSDDSLAQSISVLRRALGDDCNQPHFIATIPRKGYRFIAPVIEVVVSCGTETGLVDRFMENAPPQSADRHTALDSTPRRAPHSTWMTSFLRAGDARAIRRWAWAAGIGSAVALGVLVGRSSGGIDAAPRLAATRFAEAAPTGTRFISGGVVSPDGRHLAFVAQNDNGIRQLWVRALDSTAAVAIRGTEEAAQPFWSPDSRSIAFFATYKLKVVRLGADTPVTRASVLLNSTGGTWNNDDVILVGNYRTGLFLVRPDGSLRPVTTLEPAEQDSDHGVPQFLPDDDHYLFFISSTKPRRSGTYVGSLTSSGRRRVIEEPAVFVPPGYLLFQRDGVLRAQRFDTTTLTVVGSPHVVAGDVAPSAPVSASIHGLLAFGGSADTGHLAWFDRQGTRTGEIDAASMLRNAHLLSNQRQLVAEDANGSIRFVDLERGTVTNIAAGTGPPVSSPDGSQIAFTSNQLTGVQDLFVRHLGGTGDGKLVVRSDEPKFVMDWSKDGRYIVFASRSIRNKNDLWLLPMFGDMTPRPLLQTPAHEIQAQVSPDGRWIAYASEESGRWEVYVQTFPIPGAKRTISTAGGAQPQWRDDGREIFYLSMNRELMAVDVRPGDALVAGKPKPLFRAPVYGTLGDARNHYVVADHGERFLINTVDGRKPPEPITLISNWTALTEP